MIASIITRKDKQAYFATHFLEVQFLYTHCDKQKYPCHRRIDKRTGLAKHNCYFCQQDSRPLTLNLDSGRRSVSSLSSTCSPSSPIPPPPPSSFSNYLKRRRALPPPPLSPSSQPSAVANQPIASDRRTRRELSPLVIHTKKREIILHLESDSDRDDRPSKRSAPSRTRRDV